MMANRFWIPTLMAAALLLSACGDSEEATDTPTDDAAPVSETAEQEGTTESTGEQADEATEQPAQADEAQKANGEADTATTTTTTTTEDVEADQDTLAADPSDALEEEGGLPGEVSTSDVDDVIAETERRFEEAQQRLDEQFEEAENQAEALVPEDVNMDELGENIASDWESEMDLPESSLPENSQQEGELGQDDVQALIDETERRFEEAQQRLEEQFQELEGERAASQEAMEEEPADTSDESTEESTGATAASDSP